MNAEEIDDLPKVLPMHIDGWSLCVDVLTKAVTQAGRVTWMSASVISHGALSVARSAI